MAKETERLRESIEGGIEAHLSQDEWVRLLLTNIAKSLAVIADSMDYNESYDKVCYEASERL